MQIKILKFNSLKFYSIKYLKVKIAICVFTQVIGICISPSITFAAKINPNIADTSYWYADEDIRDVISNRLVSRLSSIYIAPAVGNSSELIADVIVVAIDEVQSGKAALIPVNLNNNHWTGLAIRKSSDGTIVVFYNDSFGTSFSENAESSSYIRAIREIIPNAQILDLQVHQQNDGSSCGAFTAENLIAFSLLDPGSLTAETARAALSTINDAKAIRLLQLGGNFALYQKLVKIEEIASSIAVTDNIEAASNIALNQMTNLASVIADRLGNLYLVDNVSGFSSGDAIAKYGIWFYANFGNSNFKYSKDSSRVKSSIKVGTIGFDTKLDSETTIGIAACADHTNSKSSNFNTNQVGNLLGSNGRGSSFTSNISSIIASLYGSFVFNEELVLSASGSVGKIFNKTNYQNILNNKIVGKSKGDLIGVNMRADYYIPVLPFTFVPNIGVSYDQIKISKIKQNNFSTNRTNIRKISVLPGISVICAFEVGSILVLPELSVSGSFSNIKSNKLVIKNDDDLVLNSRNLNIAESSFNLGSSFTLVAKMLELTIGYNKLVQKNNFGNSGYVKLRVNL